MVSRLSGESWLLRSRPCSCVVSNATSCASDCCWWWRWWREDVLVDMFRALQRERCAWKSKDCSACNGKVEGSVQVVVRLRS